MTKKPNGPAPAQVAQSVELRITMTPDGQVLLSGPLDQRALCYGLLGMAHEILIQRGTDQRDRKVAAPSSGLLIPR